MKFMFMQFMFAKIFFMKNDCHLIALFNIN